MNENLTPSTQVRQTLFAPLREAIFTGVQHARLRTTTDENLLFSGQSPMNGAHHDE